METFSLIEKHKNNPAWAEVIRMYSGLFDKQEERESFTLYLGESNVLLAVECMMSSIYEEKKIEYKLSKKALKNLEDDENFKVVRSSFVALIELGKIYDLIPIIKTKKYKHYFIKIIKESFMDEDYVKINNYIKILDYLDDEEVTISILFNIINFKISLNDYNNLTLKQKIQEYIVFYSDKEYTMKIIQLASIAKFPVTDIANIINEIFEEPFVPVKPKPTFKVDKSKLFNSLLKYIDL
jgi:hypothetical protein